MVTPQGRVPTLIFSTHFARGDVDDGDVVGLAVGGVDRLAVGRDGEAPRARADEHGADAMFFTGSMMNTWPYQPVVT